MNDRPLFYNGEWIIYNREMESFLYPKGSTTIYSYIVRLHELDKVTDEFDRDSFRKD